MDFQLSCNKIKFELKLSSVLFPQHFLNPGCFQPSVFHFCLKVTDQSIHKMNFRNDVQSYNAHYRLHRVTFHRLTKAGKGKRQTVWTALICFKLVGSSWNHQGLYVWSIRFWRIFHKRGPNTQLLKAHSGANIYKITLLLYLANKYQIFQEIGWKN